jgi:hypothetical protein
MAVAASNTLPTISDGAACSDDTWTATSTTNAPDARAGHTAVWTGSEMIIWGGYNGSNYLNAGGKYNPGADNWTAISTTNAPGGRQECTAVWTGSEMIVWGGYNYLFEHGRELQSWHGHLDNHQHKQCAHWPIAAHGGVDHAWNDRLGWMEWREFFQHRRQI